MGGHREDRDHWFKSCRFGVLVALVLRGAAREIVILDRDRKRARAVAMDIGYGAPLASVVDIRDGDYPDLAGAELVIISAGINEKSGGATDRSDPAGRLRLLETNVGVYRDILPRLSLVAPDALVPSGRIHQIRLPMLFAPRDSSEC
jgi:L-lactate dehydrogenase